jgi:hypothetical protein
MDSERTPIHSHHHAVQFYGSDQSLFTTVAGFLSEGLVAGQPALVIATESHLAGILEQLTARLIDVDQAIRIGDLIVLDAHETLAKFMASDRPDPDAFEHEMAIVIQKLVRERPRVVVRAYGEMVDVLWKQGRPEAAIALEILWNKLAATYAFALLCGYSMGNFYKQVEQFKEICRQHTDIVEAEQKVLAFDPVRSQKPA